MNDAEKQEKLLRMMEEEQKKIRNSTVNQKNPEQPNESLPYSSSNLTRCPDCGREVSIRASACPHCGSPVDIKFQKAEVKRRIKQEEKVLSEEEELLEKKIAKLKTIIDPVRKRQFRFFCYMIATGLFCWIAVFWAWEIFRGPVPSPFMDGLPERKGNTYYLNGRELSGEEHGRMMFEHMGGAEFEIMGISGHILSAIVIFLILLIVWTKARNLIFFKTPVLQNQKKELVVLKSRLEENKKESEKLVDNLKNINSPNVFATLAAGYGLHQMRDMRQELGEINETLADSGGDASGGDGGSDFTGGDFGGF